MKIANDKILFVTISIPEFLLQVSEVELRQNGGRYLQVCTLLPDESLDQKLSLCAKDGKANKCHYPNRFFIKVVSKFVVQVLQGCLLDHTFLLQCFHF